ncbi:hypothetical protein SAMN06295912_1402 [Sphingomonas laterariae]|uniref:Uncharacterized protein n=2 Tax=Edaphosphingomonas laterariae TaxID=861865 RepID=A0A239DA86_9SPHN|nr:hypothetical protein [Sphingomonas laterariae]SNS29147.1 hypothetical protein SAMN06295912_1042 [Sphingomonas laterariae]SNT09483.1 hypothetical protein SAMN06295912_1402 [Sphingomonas laterariae]
MGAKMASATRSALYDKHGREIMVGDILKVFHFIGRRNKHHFMFKQVMREQKLGKGVEDYFYISHLNFRDDGYHLHRDGSVLGDYEIVQSIDAQFDRRPRIDPKEPRP